jgi:hypothetical protein
MKKQTMIVCIEQNRQGFDARYKNIGSALKGSGMVA